MQIGRGLTVAGDVAVGPVFLFFYIEPKRVGVANGGGWMLANG